MKNVLLQNSKLQALINPIGAELSSVTNSENMQYIWQGDAAIWSRRAPVLFPIVGKLKKDRFLFNGNEYLLGQHGFARDKEFELIEQKSNSCSFQLKSDASTKEIFPFDFVFQIQFLLINNTLETTYTILNPSSTALLFSVGAHPGFNCPLHPSEYFEDYFITFEKTNYTLTELESGLRKESSKELLLPDKILNLNKKLFENDALVFENSQIDKVSLLSKKSHHGVILESPNWPYFGIWTKKDCSQFICLEPWYGIADKTDSNQFFSQKAGLIQLDPKKEFKCSFKITFL